MQPGSWVEEQGCGTVVHQAGGLLQGLQLPGLRKRGSEHDSGGLGRSQEALGGCGFRPLTLMGMLAGVERCCQVTNRFSIFIWRSSSGGWKH